MHPDETLVRDAAGAVREGDLKTLKRLLAEQPGLAAARIRGRTLLHVATDWPGHVPNVDATVPLLIEAEPNINAPSVTVRRRRRSSTTSERRVTA